MIPNDSRPGSLAEALSDARGGGRNGLTTLFRVFHPRLLRYLRAREPRAADDIASDTWLAVARRIHALEGDDAAFAAWLFTIARQRLADYRRTASRRQTDPVADVPVGVSSRASEDIVLENLSSQQAVDFIVRGLNDDQAEVTLLRTVGGLTITEVARIMGHDETWVRVTHHRALRRLESRMAQQKM
jgi:RNA polymerase sigma-70 factor, ECF subfamily